MYSYIKNARTINELESYDKVVLFGAGKSAKATIDLLKDKNIICFFDNNSDKWGKEMHGYKIYSPLNISEIIDSNTAIVISSVSYQYEIASDLINKYKVSEMDIFSYTNKYCEQFMYDTKKIIKNFERINQVINLLADDESKEYVKNCIISRLTHNPLFIKENNNISRPYEYSSLVLPKKGDVIVDCGAYIGDTAEIFLEKLDGHCKIYCIEPFKSSYDELCNNTKLNNLSDKVECLNYAVSNEARVDVIRCNEGEVHMSANLNNKQGSLENEIKIEKIDNLFKDVEIINFIKMDIEGEEVNALEGARNIISSMKPDMMISAYHLVEHIWEIPEIIKSMDLDYKIYAGHQLGVPFEIEFYVTYDKK